jgi:hypothetical protein
LWDKRSWFDKKSNSFWSVEGEGKKAVYHRFSGDRQGNYHWSGSTGINYNKKGNVVKPIEMQNVPKEIKRGQNNIQ